MAKKTQSKTIIDNLIQEVASVQPSAPATNSEEALTEAISALESSTLTAVPSEIFTKEIIVKASDNSEEIAAEEEQAKEKQELVSAEIYLRTSLDKFRVSLKDLQIKTPIAREVVNIPHLGDTFVIKCALSGDLLLPESEVEKAIAELSSIADKQLIAKEIYYLVHSQNKAKPEWLVALEETL